MSELPLCDSGLLTLETGDVCLFKQSLLKLQPLGAGDDAKLVHNGDLGNWHF